MEPIIVFKIVDLTSECCCKKPGVVKIWYSYLTSFSETTIAFKYTTFVYRNVMENHGKTRYKNIARYKNAKKICTNERSIYPSLIYVARREIKIRCYGKHLSVWRTS